MGSTNELSGLACARGEKGWEGYTYSSRTLSGVSSIKVAYKGSRGGIPGSRGFNHKQYVERLIIS